MATSFAIPLLTLPAGVRQFGPVHPADAESSVTLTIDRTVAGGLNSLDAGSGLAVALEQSNDGGASWRDLGAWTAAGGTFVVDRIGTLGTVSSGTWPLFAGTSRQLRATLTVTGTPIAVAGSIATQ